MITVSHISKAYKKKTILRDITFSAESGEQIAIIGRNGCGKSTLMQILAGIMKPDAGELLYYNQTPLHNQKLFQKFCGYVPQENPLIEEVSVQDNISLWTGKRGKPEQYLMEMFQLDEILKMRVDKLSGGMKRRVSIACAIANWPPVLLMDEPTTALDIYYQKSIHDLMRDYRKRNGIIIITTHDQTEIQESSKVFLMSDGCVTLQDLTT